MRESTIEKLQPRLDIGKGLKTHLVEQGYNSLYGVCKYIEGETGTEIRTTHYRLTCLLRDHPQLLLTIEELLHDLGLSIVVLPTDEAELIMGNQNTVTPTQNKNAVTPRGKVRLK